MPSGTLTSIKTAPTPSPSVDEVQQLDLYYLECNDKTPNVPIDKGSRGDFSPLEETKLVEVNIPDKLRCHEPLPPCASGFMKGECTNGHHFAKAMLCGKEFCTHCGDNWSWIHQRKYWRWVPKFKVFDSVGYMVITIPKEVRYQFYDRKRLQQFRVYIHAMMKREGFSKGLSRWHWCGEDGKTWHPHINLLFGAGHLPKEKLIRLRELITARLSFLCNKSIDTIVLNYRYSTERGKKYHWLKYVTRATFRTFDHDIYRTTKGFHNNTPWGKWEKPKGSNDIAKLESSICPICDSPIKWSGFSGELDMWDWHKLKAGYYVWNYKENDP